MAQTDMDKTVFLSMGRAPSRAPELAVGHQAGGGVQLGSDAKHHPLCGATNLAQRLQSRAQSPGERGFEPFAVHSAHQSGAE